MLGLIVLAILSMIGLLCMIGILTVGAIIFAIALKLLFLPFIIAIVILKGIFHLIF